MKLKLFSLLAVISTAFITNVSAASSSGVQPAPSLTPGSVINTTVYNLTTTKSNQSVTGPDTSVIFSGYTALPNTLAGTDNGRKMIVTLMEEDQYPNEDDKVKTYTWTFKNRIMDSVTVQTNDYGNIDSAGDPTVELYLSILLQKMPGDSTAATGRLFWYNISVK